MYSLFWVRLATAPGRATIYLSEVATFSDPRIAAEYAVVWKPRNNSTIGYRICLQSDSIHTSDPLANPATTGTTLETTNDRD